MNSRLRQRRFIKSVNYFNAATKSGAGFYLASAASDQPPGAVERFISINTNGHLRRVDVLPQEILAHPIPTLKQTRQALSGNLCRCGAYQPTLNGVLCAAELI